MQTREGAHRCICRIKIYQYIGTSTLEGYFPMLACLSLLPNTLVATTSLSPSRQPSNQYIIVTTVVVAEVLYTLSPWLTGWVALPLFYLRRQAPWPPLSRRYYCTRLPHLCHYWWLYSRSNDRYKNWKN